jgi:hypothetical protein
MKIITFKNKRWDEIPKQDNPAFDYIDLNEYESLRREACILITKVMPYRRISKDGYSVTEVPKQRIDVICRGLFWNLEDAQAFANAIANPPTT